MKQFVASLLIVSSLATPLPADDDSLNRLQSQHLPNLVQVHPRVLSGGLPESDAAFAELAGRGIKTIVSVDGMKPDVATAEKHGLRYVHLPHGYDGVPLARGKELAKAVRDLEGPIYIHCHHGKHRSPAAATVACVSAGLLPAERAVDVMKLAGTSVNYRGLYQSATAARPLTPAELDAVEVEFRSVSKIPPLAEAMVDLEHTFAQVKLIAQSNWRVPPRHPDLDPKHETLLLQEHFVEMLRSEEVQRASDEYQRLMKASGQAAEEILHQLERWQPTTESAAFPSGLTDQLRRVQDNCKACHERFRDVPLTEKR